MKKNYFYRLLLVLCFAIAVSAQTNLKAPIPIEPNVKIGKLENGLTYYIRKNAKPEKKVELRLAINAGSILEREDQQGLAHFLEHMAFNGTKNFKKNELVSYLQSIGVKFGADLNAYTGFDQTVYILPIPTENKELIDKGLLILSDWASAIDLSAEEVKKERGVVLEELRLGRGADQRMRDRYFPKVFQGSQYAVRLPIGKKETLENFQMKSLTDFYEDWYRPDLMAIVAVGDLDVVEMEQKIKTVFSKIKPKRATVKRPGFPVPDHKETLIAIETDKEAAYTSVQLLFKKTAQKPETLADYKRGITKSFFNGMLNARLDELRQSPNPPFIGGGAFFSPLVRSKDSFLMVGVTDPKSLKSTLAALLEENRRVQVHGFTEGELERRKEAYLTSMENAFKEREKFESGTFATLYVSHFLEKTPIPGIEFDYKFARAIVPTITLQEVNALAKETTTEENRVVLIAGAEQAAGVYPTEAEIVGLLKDSQTAKVTPYAETVSKEPLVDKLSTAATVTEEKYDKNFGITHWKLSNGIRVALKPTDFNADQIEMTAYSPGGLSLVGDDKAFSGKYVSQIVAESGLKNLSKVQLQKQLAGKSAAVGVSLTNSYEYMDGFSTPKDFETLMQLVYLQFTAVNFDNAVFDSFIFKQKKLVPSLLANPQTYFSDQASKILTQNHPRVFGTPTVEDLDKINFEDIKTIYKDRFGDASDFTFVFVGNFENEKIKPVILKYLGSLPDKKRIENWKDLGIRPPKGKLEKVIRRGVDDKSLVRINFTGEAKFDLADDRLLSVLSDLLEIKLIEVLREEKSGVYGVSAGGGMSKIPNEQFSFGISFSCGPENVDALTKAALAEVVKIQEGKIEETDLGKVKESRLVEARERVKQNSYWASEITNSLRENMELSSLSDVENRTKAIKKEDIQRVAKKYLNTEQNIKIVLIPESDKTK